MLGGFVVQFPVARLSNRYGRRNIILLWAVLAAAASLAVLLAMWFWPGSPLPHYLTAFVFGCSLFTLYSLSLARANDVLPNNMNTVEISRSLLFCYGMGSLAAPLLLGVAMEQARHYGFYGVYLVCALLLAGFAWRQKPVPQAERSVFVGMPGDSGAVIADLDPRNEAAHEPFDAAAAQAHVDTANQDTPNPEQDKADTPPAA